MDKSIDKEFKQEIDQVNRRASIKRIKREYNKICSCERCKLISVQSNLVIGYQCNNCSKYNNVDKAIKRYESGDFKEPSDKRSKISMPAVMSLDTNKREYTNLRDEYEIRADLFSKGITRQSIGPDKFNKKLKNELVQNKCYRGQDKTGV